MYLPPASCLLIGHRNEAISWLMGIVRQLFQDSYWKSAIYCFRRVRFYKSGRLIFEIRTQLRKRIMTGEGWKVMNSEFQLSHFRQTDKECEGKTCEMIVGFLSLHVFDGKHEYLTRARAYFLKIETLITL
jgi:hypothetical protein